MHQWEYLVVYIEDTDIAEDPVVDAHMDADKYTEALNRYGVAGWELVNFQASDAGMKAAFKRPKQS